MQYEKYVFVIILQYRGFAVFDRIIRKKGPSRVSRLFA